MKNDSGNNLLTPSVAKLKRMIGPSPVPRMLTPSEIALLRQSKAEVDWVTGEVLADKDKEMKARLKDRFAKGQS